jgi:RND family efflux transporter MFP subunit
VNVSPVAISGFLTRVMVDVGDRVQQGQLVAEVDCREYAAQRSQTEHVISRNRAQLDQAESQLARLRTMDEKKLLAPADLDQGQLARDVAQAQLADAQARLRETTQRLGYCKLRAPFDGWVSERLLDPGEMVRPGGRPVVMLVKTKHVRVVVPLLEQDIAKVRPNAEVQVVLRALQRPIHGRVARLGRMLDPATRTLPIEIDLENPGEELLPGMTGQVSIVTERRHGALVVPVTAVLTLEQGAWLFVVREGRARRVPVQLGVDLGDWLEVRSGIAQSDKVITVGRDLVADGTEVTVATPLASPDVGGPRVGTP